MITVPTANLGFGIVEGWDRDWSMIPKSCRLFG
jgi:hypothetical protein